MTSGPSEQSSPCGAACVMDGERLISRAELRDFISISDMSLHRWLQAKKFPPPIYIGTRRFWRASEVAAWLAEQSKARDQ